MHNLRIGCVLGYGYRVVGDLHNGCLYIWLVEGLHVHSQGCCCGNISYESMMLLHAQQKCTTVYIAVAYGPALV